MALRQSFLFSLSVGLLFYSAPVLSETTVEQSLEAGFQQWNINSPEAKFQEYRDVPQGFFIERYGLQTNNDAIGFSLELNKIRQDDQSAHFDLDIGRFNLQGSWDQTPHLYSNEAATPFSVHENGVLLAPEQIRRDIQNSTATYTAYEDALRPIELKTRTDKGAVNAAYRLSDRLSARIGVSETIKKGSQPLGASFTRSHIVQIAQPIDYKTYDSNIGLGYAGKTYQWNMGYGFSAFRNDIETLTVDNPRRYTDSRNESSQGQLSAAPDNVAHFVSINGGANLPAKTRFTTDIQMSYMRQNQSLLPFTINTATTTDWTDRSRLPADKADATVINWEQDYRLTNKFLNFLTAGARYHSSQQNNKTPEYTFDGSVGLDFYYLHNDTHNHAFEMRKDTLDGTLDFQVHESLGIGLDYGSAWMKREHREVRDTVETTAGLSADFRPCRWFLMRSRYSDSRRRMKDFDATALTKVNEIPGLRRYDVADRDRRDGQVLIQMSSQKTSLGIRGLLGYDQYKPGKGDLASTTLSNSSNTNTSTMYGLLEARRAGFGVDFDQIISDGMSFFTFYDYQLDKNRHRSNYSNHNAPPSQDTANNWSVQTVDRYHTAGAGLNADLGRIMLTLGYDMAHSKGHYDYVEKGSSLTNLENYPETRTTKQDFYVQAKVPVSSALSFAVGYLYEKFDVYDWSADQVPNVNLPSYTPNYSGNVTSSQELLLGDSIRDYQAHIVTAKINYKF